MRIGDRGEIHPVEFPAEFESVEFSPEDDRSALESEPRFVHLVRAERRADGERSGRTPGILEPSLHAGEHRLEAVEGIIVRVKAGEMIDRLRRVRVVDSPIHAPTRSDHATECWDIPAESACDQPIADLEVVRQRIPLGDDPLNERIRPDASGLEEIDRLNIPARVAISKDSSTRFCRQHGSIARDLARRRRDVERSEHEDLVLHNGEARPSAELIPNELPARRARQVVEERVRIQHRVPVEFEDAAVKLIATARRHQTNEDRSAASRRRIGRARRDAELLDVLHRR
jgi:hypothetical protein